MVGVQFSLYLFAFAKLRELKKNHNLRLPFSPTNGMSLICSQINTGTQGLVTIYFVFYDIDHLYYRIGVVNIIEDK